MLLVRNKTGNRQKHECKIRYLVLTSGSQVILASKLRRINVYLNRIITTTAVLKAMALIGSVLGTVISLLLREIALYHYGAEFSLLHLKQLMTSSSKTSKDHL